MAGDDQNKNGSENQEPEKDDKSGGQNGSENQNGNTDQLGEAGKKALDAMKAERNAALKAQREAEAKIKQFEDAGKSESEKLSADRDSHKTRADSAEKELMRLRVAVSKGLSESQAKRLVGDSKEELEADADELLTAFGNSNGSQNSGVPSNKPEERYRGGGNDPGEAPMEMDPEKLAAQIKR